LTHATTDSGRTIARAASSVEGVFIGALAAALLVSALASGLDDMLWGFAQPIAVTAVLAVAFVIRPISGLLALVIFVLGYDTLGLYVGNAVKRTDELAIPTLALIAFARYRPWQGWRWSLLREGGMVLFVAAGIAGSLLNQVPITIWAPALVLVMKPIVVFYVAAWIPVDRPSILAAARIVLAIGTAVVILGLVEAIDPGAFQRAIGLPEWVRPRGVLPSIKSVFTHPAIFAWFMSMLAIYCFIGYVHLRNRWLLALGFMFGVSVFLSARRRAILAMVGTIGLAFAWSVRKIERLQGEFRRWVPVFAATALMVVAFIPGLTGLYDRTVDRYLPGETPEPTDGLVGAPDDEDVRTEPARIALYVGSLEIARDHFPFGAGMGRYGSWMSRVEYSPLYAEYGLNRIPGLRADNSQYATDTFWPMVVGEFGIFGVLGYTAFLAGVGLTLWVLGRKATDPVMAVFVVGGLAVLVAATIESTATPMFTAPPRSYLVFAAIGTTLGLWGSLRTPPPDAGPEAR
jgi:hypothetical protein